MDTTNKCCPTKGYVSVLIHQLGGKDDCDGGYLGAGQLRPVALDDLGSQVFRPGRLISRPGNTLHITQNGRSFLFFSKIHARIGKGRKTSKIFESLLWVRTE
jgi:hypothetical protein